VVIALAAIIGVLLVAGAVRAAVRVTAVTAVGTTSNTTTAPTDPASSSTAPSTSTGQPTTSIPSTTSPKGVAPVSPLAVPPVTAPSVSARPLNLSPTVIAAMVNPAVVDIDTRLAYQHAIAAGTGMVLTSNGVVLTNNHVIDGATTIGAVSIGNGKSYSAQVLGVDPTADVAVIQLIGASGLRTITASTTPVSPGDPVVAIGNAGGQGGPPSVTTGTVEAVGQSIIANDPAAGTSEELDGLIATSASLQPGDSGGPLVNGSGQIIGMDTAASVANQLTPTTSFAIPIDQALGVARQIQAGQSSSTIHLGLPPFLGVQVTANGGSRPGALVSSVVTGSPAAAIGINPGAVIAAINGQAISSAATLSSVLRQFRPGDSVTINWFDKLGNGHSARVTLGTGPAD
jgi:S1-C subfamily serine protease